MTDTAKRVAWTFVMTFVGVFLTFAPGLLAAPNYSNAKAAILAALAAGIAAAGSAIKNAAFPPGHPAR